MLRTALGPAITGWLEDPAIVEVMLNPDGRLWIDRLAGGLADTGERLSALLAEVANTPDRVVLIEDTRELQCKAPNLVALRTKDGVASLSDLVRSSLRLRPDRIPIGEVRGSEALDLLKAWGTGHPGGIGTIHAGSAVGALRRLEQLIQEAVVTVPRALIAETIDLIAVLAGRGGARRLVELAAVEGLGAAGDYVLTPAVERASAGERA
jgi:type IV secretion system protein VirB11